MGYLVLGGLVLAVLYLFAKWMTQSNPAKLAEVLKMLIGGLLLVYCAFLALTGKYFVALPLAAFALSLLGGDLRKISGFPAGFPLVDWEGLQRAPVRLPTSHLPFSIWSWNMTARSLRQSACRYIRWSCLEFSGSWRTQTALARSATGWGQRCPTRSLPR